MARGVAILGTVHEIQGAEKFCRRKVEDPAYLDLVKQLLIGKDFVFEEASGLGPTKAEQLAREQLGSDHYLDIDPHASERSAYGIGETGRQFPIDPYSGNTDSFQQEFESEQSKRESLWLDRIGEANFTNALLICGYLHTLSMGYKLRTAEFRVEAWTYVPYFKLCPWPHNSEKTY
jgi:hypothetical protein